MRLRIRVGEVAIDVAGLDLTRRDVTRLLKRCADANAGSCNADEPEVATPPLGFSAPVLERLPDDLADPP